MPLRDHFHPPVSKHSSWEGFHGYWPAAMVEKLAQQLPAGYVAEPRVRLGSFFEIDVSTYEDERDSSDGPQRSSNGSTVTTYVPPAPSLVVDLEIPEQYEYEVLIYDVERDRKLVAAIEMVSPANKDRPESRRMYAPAFCKRAFASRLSIWLPCGMPISTRNCWP